MCNITEQCKKCKLSNWLLADIFDRFIFYSAKRVSEENRRFFERTAKSNARLQGGNENEFKGKC